jgi:hypothetical protein
LFDPATQAWESVREAVLEIDKLCFGEKSFSEEYLKQTFEDPRDIVVLLKRAERLIGFSSAIPDEKVEGAMYVDTTDIIPEEQGKKHVVAIMQLLETEARKRGFRYLTRNAAVENGYADKVEKNYAGRILETGSNDSEWGPQRYFKIEL